MLLGNSKLTQLVDRPDGRKRFALDCSVAPIQMSPDGQAWEDIVPLLVKQGNQWVSQGTPYLVEFDSRAGRKIYPDRTDLSKYISLPTNALWRNINKTWSGNQVVASLPNYDFIFELQNSKIAFKVVMRQAPPFDQIKLDVDSVGFNLAQLLTAKSGLGIPQPRLIDAEGTERFLDWSFANGQLTLGFDLAGLVFPVTLHNTTIDVQVGVSAGDGFCKNPGQTGVYSNNATVTYAGVQQTVYNAPLMTWARFPGITGIDGTVTIDVAYYSTWNVDAGSPLTKIRAESAAAPAAPTTEADAQGRTRTTAGVDWDGVNPASQWNNSPSIVSVIEEIKSLTPTVIQIFHMDDGSTSSSNNYMMYRTYDNTNSPANTWGPKLHIEYSAGGGGWANIGKVNGIASASIGKINGLAQASIAKINGVAV